MFGALGVESDPISPVLAELSLSQRKELKDAAEISPANPVPGSGIGIACLVAETAR